MHQAQHGNTVRLHYTGRLEDGTIFDSSRERDPLEFTIGAHHVIAGFEQGTEGLAVGESRTLTIPADQAYGQHREDLVVVLPRTVFPTDAQIAIGDQFQMSHTEGGVLPVRVMLIGEGTVTVDANHALAGKTLIFDIELIEIL